MLWLPLPSFGIGDNPWIKVPVIRGSAGEDAWLAQGKPGQAPTDAQVEELIRRSDALEAKGEYGEAAGLWEQILAIVEQLRDPEHPDTARSFNNLAELYRSQGRYGEAEPLYKRALAISEKVLGPGHPETAVSLNNLAGLYLLQTNSTAAIPLLQRLNRHQANCLLGELPRQSRDLRNSLLDKQPDAIGSTFALLDQNPTAGALALETRLNRQGLLAEIERRQALLKSSNPETRRLAEQVAGIDRLLASVSLPPAQREPLRQQRQQLESKLYRLLPALKDAAPQGLLVEFQKYRPWGKGAKGKGEWGPPRYVALLLRPDGSIRSIPLGAAEPIDAAIADAVAASASSDRQAEAPQRLAAVSQRLLKPLQAELKGVRELFVSPDGELNRLPFAALPVAATDGPTLGESVRLRLLTTGRELVRLQQPGKATALISNPDFGPLSRSAKSPLAPPAALRDLGPWPPLPGTATEAEGLTPTLRPQASISGRAATAVLVAQQKGPRILHIATHGFFLAPQNPTAGPTPQLPPCRLNRYNAAGWCSREPTRTPPFLPVLQIKTPISPPQKSRRWICRARNWSRFPPAKPPAAVCAAVRASTVCSAPWRWLAPAPPC